MTITVQDVWYAGGTNKRIKNVLFTAVATAEDFVILPTQIGLADIYGVSAVAGVDGAEATAFGVASNAAGNRIRARSAGADTWVTTNATRTVKLLATGL